MLFADSASGGLSEYKYDKKYKEIKINNSTLSK